MKLDILIRFLKKLTQSVEKVIIITLIIMMSVVLIFATIELGYFFLLYLGNADSFLISLDGLTNLFGVFLLVLIGIELLDTIKIYLKQNVVHVEVVVLVAIIALARKIVIIEVEQLTGDYLIGMGVLIAALALAYYLIKKAGFLTFNLKNQTRDEVVNDVSDDFSEDDDM